MKKGIYHKKIFEIGFASLFFLIMSGCAHNQEFISKIKKEQWLYNDEYSTSDLFDYDAIGSDKSGYIPKDKTPARLDFEKTYPRENPKLEDIEAIKSSGYIRRLGQVIRLASDLDKRTSGFIKDDYGIPLSVSGNIDVNPVNPIETAAISGATQAIAASSSSASLINPAQGAGYNIGAGLVVGLVAGIIAQAQIDSAMKGIISKEDFGSRMEETTFAAGAPGASIMSKYGFLYNGNHILLPNKSVKSIFAVEGTQDISRRTRIFIITVNGVYRGLKYKEKFPKTEGWEFTITNMNSIVIKELYNHEQRLKEISEQMKIKNIEL